MNIESYIKQLEEHFNGKPWFGTSVWSSLENIPYSFWNVKLNNISHSILELVLHMIDWRGFVIEKLQGNEAFSIEMNSEQDWLKGVVVNTDDDKQLVMSELMESQKQLCELLQDKTYLWLSEEASGENYSNEYMIQGIVPHDIYHLGQINLIYKQAKVSL
ncbi:DinB family protein [Aquimarina sp. ERC-38]|uniref:DinB family protein n=1 Tax=Aquimarina sp. ERC-38 TaxID=2949996 RepID=UPI002245B625|nr:DinB family protein [Aquimarina sp. ERC-38]UZO80989.1 DinB family protein [Aquimarina sp. ERC-38]